MGSYPARSAYEDSGIDFFLHLSDIIWAMFNCIDFCVFLYTYVFCLKTVWAVYHHYYDISFFANSNNIRTSQQNYRILGSLQQSEKCARTQSWGSTATRWCPPSYKLVYNPMKTVDISPTKSLVIGVINQLNAIERGHHLVVVGGSQTLNKPNHCWVSFWGLSTINHYPFLTITIICSLISINTSGFVVLLWTIINHH